MADKYRSRHTGLQIDDAADRALLLPADPPTVQDHYKVLSVTGDGLLVYTPVPVSVSNNGPSGAQEVKYITINGETSKLDGGSHVLVGNDPPATTPNTVKYITIDGVTSEFFAGTVVSVSNTIAPGITPGIVKYITIDNETSQFSGSQVSVGNDPTGVTGDPVKYITIDGVKSRIVGDLIGNFTTIAAATVSVADWESLKNDHYTVLIATGLSQLVDYEFADVKLTINNVDYIVRVNKNTAGNGVSARPEYTGLFFIGETYSDGQDEYYRDYELSVFFTPSTVTLRCALVGERLLPAANKLTFSSTAPFTVSVYDETKHWNGELEYSTDGNNWSVWDYASGSVVLPTLSSGTNNANNVLYMRGLNNNYITGNDFNARWVLSGTDNIRVTGNISALLDAVFPMPMDTACFASLFYGCSLLSEAPTLDILNLSQNCYAAMFYGCTNLTTAPALPATTLAQKCYLSMFYGCTGLTTAPALSATTLASHCYSQMFKGCTSLTTAPAISATILANNCCYSMFDGCTSLTTAPVLSATTLAESCYWNMFRDCVGLTIAPALPATVLARNCYADMFYNCTSLTAAPTLAAMVLADYCYFCMFWGCTGLTTSSALPATTLADHCYDGMFYGCTELVSIPALPATSLADNCYNKMFQGCTKVKMSTTQAGEYQTVYRIPVSGTVTGVSTDATLNMFKNITLAYSMPITPSLETNYYTSNTVIS